MSAEQSKGLVIPFSEHPELLESYEDGTPSIEIPFPGGLIAEVVEELRAHPEWDESYGKEAHGEEELYRLIYRKIIQAHSEDDARVMGVRSVLTYRRLYHKNAPVDAALRTVANKKKSGHELSIE